MSLKFFKAASLLTLLIGFSSNAGAQMLYSRKYRVIAYKNGDLSTYSVSNEVEIIPAMTLYIPNSFTPNNDGMNDSFGIAGEAVKDFNMVIFNRWGQKIFESSDANFRWDGTYQGEKVPEGVYGYRVSARGANGKKAWKEGNVTVVM